MNNPCPKPQASQITTCETIKKKLLVCPGNGSDLRHTAPWQKFLAACIKNTEHKEKKKSKRVLAKLFALHPTTKVNQVISVVPSKLAKKDIK